MVAAVWDDQSPQRPAAWSAPLQLELPQPKAGKGEGDDEEAKLAQSL